jgi:phage shock protein PspC (stress-responsive transcriptional regulator)
MNKTVTINISGIIFHIEEDAYEKLSKYLTTIKGYFSKTDGGNEIMSDIEARIAEMLQAKTSAVKQVVLMADVDSVIETMGKPEEFAEGPTDDSGTNTTQEEEYTSGHVKRRLFRDPDHKAIGGVCSGIAAYFDVDTVWIRLAMFLLIFFGGLSLWVYIILWIVIPEAKTTADKLAMRGEKIDINNISKTVKEEAEQIKKRMAKYGSDLKNDSRPKDFFEKLGDFLRDFIMLFAKFFVRLIGLFLLIFGVIFLLGLMSTVFGFSIAGANTEFNDWVNLFFINRSHYTIGLFGAILFFGVPILMMLYGGIKLLFKIHYSNRWLNISAGLIWFVGLIILAFVGVKTGQDFTETGKVKEEVKLVQSDTMILKLNKSKELMEILGMLKEEDGRFRIHNRHSDYMIGKDDHTKFLVGHASLNVLPSQTDSFELYFIKKARGAEKRIAVERAKSIEYKTSQEGNTISFDELFVVPSAEKFRVQELQVILKVPRNKVIYLDKSLENFIYDVENVTNTFDGDMVGRRWIMTDEGLACVDCNGLEDHSHDYDHVIPPPVHPQHPGHPSEKMSINADDADVKINKDGIKITSKEADVNIGKDGIHIDTKEKK